METVMRHYMGRFKDVLRYSSPYVRAASLATVALLVLLLFALRSLIPKATATSAQAGLAIVAEILGVLFGVVLAIAAFLREQRFKAEELLRRKLSKYRDLILDHLLTVYSARQQLIRRVNYREIGLDNPIYVGPSGRPSSTSWRDVLCDLSTLVSVFSDSLTSSYVKRVKHDLEELDFCEDEVIDVLYVHPIHAGTDPQTFLQLVHDGLQPVCIGPDHFDPSSLDLARLVLDEYERDGVDQALRSSDRSSEFLGSKTFAATVIVPAVTCVLAVLAIFGVTDTTVHLLPYRVIVVAILTGFVLSAVLALLLVAKLVA